MKKYLFVFLLITVVGKIFCQSSTGTISGTVSEEKTGEYIISLTVVLYKDSISSKPFRGTYTNKFGYYSFSQILPGEYYLVAKGVGYQQFSKKIRLKEGENLRLNITMKTADVVTEEVLVTAERSSEEAISRISTVNIAPSFIFKLPSLGGETDVFRALQTLPGVKQSSELSSGLYIRGGSPDQNLYLLDGVIVYNPNHLGGFLSVFNGDALRDIKLIKGAFPAEYGGRLSSVLDMTMKEGRKDRFSADGGISLISSRLTLEGPISENASFMLSGRRMYFDVLTSMFVPKDEVPNYYFYDLNAKVNYKVSENSHIFLSGFLCRDVLESPEDEEMKFDINWGNKTSNLRWLYIVSPLLFTNFSLIYTDYSFRTDIYDKKNIANNFISKSLIRDWTFRAEAQYFPEKNHKIKTGLEAINHRFLAKTAFNFENNLEIPFNSKDATSIELSYYLQDEWDVTDRLATNIGSRLYYFEEADYVRFEPRFSATYKLADNTSIKTSLSMAHQFLHLIIRNDISVMTDLWFPSTKNVLPSRSTQTVIGVEQLFDEGKYLLSLEGYYKKMNNLYEYKDSATFSFGIPLENQFTRGNGEAYGVEVFINKRLGNFTGWIGYTLSWTKRKFKELNEGKPFYPRYDRRHDVNIVLVYEISPSWEIGATWYYGTGQAYTMPTGSFRFEEIGLTDYEDIKYQYTERNGARLPAFHKLDINFLHHFEWFSLPWTVSLNIYNAYNRRNPFAWYISTDYDGTTETKKLKQLTLFPLIPTIGLSFKI
ncbi:MAG: TonB-dependent receptor [Ignavibacteria bacterium]|nr:TonB-dependent receptor [Ignavibacteria bacterium]